MKKCLSMVLVFTLLLSLPVFASALYSSSYGPNSIYNEEHVHEWEDATLSDPMACSVCGETQGEPRHLQWNEIYGDDTLSVGYYRNSANDRYWIEIKLDASIEVLVQLLQTGDWIDSYGLYNKYFYDWIGKLDDYTDTAYEKGSITYFEDTAQGWGHWLVWMDMDSKDHTVLGLANNKRTEIEVFIAGKVGCETMKVGSKGTSVEELQQQLIDLGYLTGRADGDFAVVHKKQ